MLLRLISVLFTVLHMHALRWWREYLMALGALVVASCLAYFVFLAPPSAFPIGKTISIESGLSLRQIAAVLKEHKAIRSQLAFKLLVRASGYADSIDAGTYLFDKPLSTIGVAYRLVKGEYGIPEIRVTIPEGSTARESAVLMGVAFSPEFASAYLAEAVAYEGYLFPDTYHFSAADSAESVVAYQRETFDERTASLAPLVAASGHTLAQVVTMASLLEGEANNETDMKIVAGILWKRLSLGMALQVDAARETYERVGLPASPINNPGLVALNAALAPTKTSYLFYLTGDDGKMHYGKNFAEHQANLAKYLK